MNPVHGFYYDGRRSARNPVSLEQDGAHLRIRGDDVDLTVPLEAITLSPRIGAVRQSIRLPNGGLIEIDGELPVEQMFGVRKVHLFHRILHRWERSLLLAVVALLLTFGVIAGIIRFVLPAMARHVAFAIPPAAEVDLGRESLSFIDRYLMKPSQLSNARQAEITALFSDMKSRVPGAAQYRIELRSSDRIGANAFALPGGIIVVTDRMTELAGRDDQLVGVLAHEAAHVRSRHALRHVLQSTGTGLLIAAITGDVTSITSLAAAIPTTLIDAGYSREFENEADDEAVDYLVRAGIKPGVYADTLARLQADHEAKSGGKEQRRRWSPLSLLATHPDTAERIGRIQGRERSIPER